MGKCIITYKGQKYSEEQFKEYFINNKQEFATSIAKNKDIIDSFKRKMEGIDFVFSQSPELASIGSKAQYLQYLSTIFKTSKVKDIVYHGTGKKDWKPFKGKNFFTSFKDATNYANVVASEEFLFNNRIIEPKIIAVLINSNPEIVNKTLSIEEIDNYETTSNGIIANVEEPIGLQKQYVVFEPEQIHILGSKQDKKGFQNLINKEQNYSVDEINNNLKEGFQWLKEIMPDVQVELVDGLIDNIAKGSYNILTDLITLSKDYADKKVIKEEAFHRIFNLLPKSEQEKLLNEGSKKYGIERGESKAIIKYSAADQNRVNYVLKSVEILQSDKAKQVFTKGEKNNWSLDKILTELQIPKEQRQLILDLGIVENKPNVILPIGTSGSGKSTFIKSLPQENLVVIEPDAMRVEFTGDMNDKSKDKEIYVEAANRAIKAIKQGKQVVFDTTNLTKDKRLPFIEAIKKAIPTANIQYKLMELNPELAKQRIKADIAAGKNRANVPDSTIDRHAESYKQMLEDIKSEPVTEFRNTDLRERIALELASNYSYVVDINTAKNPKIGEKYIDTEYGYELEVTEESLENQIRDGMVSKEGNTQYYSNLTVPGGTNGSYIEANIETPLITPSIKGHAQFATDKGIGWFRSDDKEMSFQSSFVNPDGSVENIFDKTKTRRILEVQSDLFQKGRDKEDLILKQKEDSLYTGIKQETTQELYKEAKNKGKEVFAYHDYYYLYNNKYYSYSSINNKYYVSENNSKINTSENQFLQLLNKDNNWVTFFVKSIIQDSAKKGYEKVLFPSGNTASKVEGHTTLEEFKKQKEDRIEALENENKGRHIVISANNKREVFTTEQRAKEVVEFYNKEIDEDNPFSVKSYYEYKPLQKEILEANNKEITQLKQELERVETEGFGALKPIYNFYENTVTNILKKQGFNPILITDEYGNTWNEITITPKMSETIRLNTPNGKIEYTGDLAIEEKMAEEAFNSKDEKVPTTALERFIQSIRNIFRNLFKEKDNIGKLIRNLNQGRFNKVLNLYVNPDFVNEQHNKLPSSQRNDVEVDLSKDQKFFNEKKQITQQFTSLQKPKNVLQEEWDFLTEEEREKLNNCK